MNTTNAASAKMTVRTTTSQYGCLNPTLTVELAKVPHYRIMRAELYRIAAIAETASENEEWVINVEHDTDRTGRIRIELATEFKAEAQRAETMLRKIAGIR